METFHFIQQMKYIEQNILTLKNYKLKNKQKLKTYIENRPSILLISFYVDLKKNALICMLTGM